MKKIEKTKEVKYNVYISDDGQEFNNEKDCIFHDRLINGEVKICEECNGSGEVKEEYWDENYHTGVEELYTRWNRCKCCNGKGYLEKHIETVWK